MKRHLWITALLAALAMVFSGCGNSATNDDDEEGEEKLLDLATVFDATEETQDKANVAVNGSDVVFTVTGVELWGELVAGSYDASAYAGFKFEYKSTGSATVYVQDTNDLFAFLNGSSDGYGAVPGVTEWAALEIPFATLLNRGWVSGNSSTPFDASQIIKFCVTVSDGSESAKSFEIRNFAAYGKKESQAPSDTTAYRVVTDSVKINGSAVTLTKAFDTEYTSDAVKEEYYNPWNTEMQFFAVPGTSLTSLEVTITLSAGYARDNYFFLSLWVNGYDELNWVKEDVKQITAAGQYTFTYTPASALTIAADGIYVGIESSAANPTAQ
ncbi:MAG: hypothetical protein LBS97_05500 [Treponema sp.]|jgi:hypothetical protein|nr:hypothetical protein [Treponema sp.]